MVGVDDVLEELDASVFGTEEQTVPGNKAMDRYKETKSLLPFVQISSLFFYPEDGYTKHW
jgi:hypothetical protein